jgi:Na+/H+ antiporter NhaD/arsenite permease-like protein
MSLQGELLFAAVMTAIALYALSRTRLRPTINPVRTSATLAVLIFVMSLLVIGGPILHGMVAAFGSLIAAILQTGLLFLCGAAGFRTIKQGIGER